MMKSYKRMQLILPCLLMVIVFLVSGCKGSQSSSANTGANEPSATLSPSSVSYMQNASEADMEPLILSYTGMDTANMSIEWQSIRGGAYTTVATTTEDAPFYPLVNEVGDFEYVAVITLEDGRNIRTNAVSVSVLAPELAITEQPQDFRYAQGTQANIEPLHVVATGAGAYQWYQNNTNSTQGATMIDGATEASFTPPAQNLGIVYYFCTVSAAQSTDETINSRVASVEVYVAENANAVQITSQAQNARYARHTQEGDVADLFVRASGGNGTFQYQWYQNTQNTNTGGAAINGANSSSYKPSTYDLGTAYYYCVVQSGNTTATSNTIAVEVFAPAAPVVAVNIVTNPVSARYLVGTQASQVTPLSVQAQGDSLSYAWYVSTENSNSGRSAIAGATTNTYIPPTTTVGKLYYYCVVTGPSTTATSTPAGIEVFPQPSITTQPQSATYEINNNAAPLTVVATGDNLTYQWYSRIDNNHAEIITGAIAASYTPPTNALGRIGYFCVVSSTVNGVSGNISSQEAILEVQEPAPAPAPAGPVAEITVTPTTVSTRSATMRANYIYTLSVDANAVSVANVPVTFSIPELDIPPGVNIEEYVYGLNIIDASQSATSTVEQNMYSGTTNANGVIAFSLFFGSTQPPGRLTVTATEDTYNTTANVSITIEGTS